MGAVVWWYLLEYHLRGSHVGNDSVHSLDVGGVLVTTQFRGGYAKKHVKNRKEYHGAMHRGDGHDQERIDKAKAKRQRRNENRLFKNKVRDL